MLPAEVETMVDPGERMCTVGATVSAADGALARVTSTVFEAVFPEASVTVKVIWFAPELRGSDPTVQLALPDAAPDPLSLVHVMRSVPVPPAAVPEAVSVEAV